MIDNPQERLADHGALGNVAEAIRQLQELGRVVLSEFQGGESAEGDHVVGAPARIS